MKNSQARTGHQRGIGGRETDDDDTHERHTDTNKLTRHTASGLPHTQIIPGKILFYSERWLRPIASTVNHVVDRGLNPQPSG